VQSNHPNDTMPPDGQHLLLGVYRYPLQSVYYQQAALKAL